MRVDLPVTDCECPPWRRDARGRRSLHVRCAIRSPVTRGNTVSRRCPGGTVLLDHDTRSAGTASVQGAVVPGVRFAPRAAVRRDAAELGAPVRPGLVAIEIAGRRRPPVPRPRRAPATRCRRRRRCCGPPRARRRLAAAAGRHRRLLRAGLRHRQRRVPPRRPGRASSCWPSSPASSPTPPPSTCQPRPGRRRRPGADARHPARAASPPAAGCAGCGPAAPAPSGSIVVGRGGAVLELVDRVRRERFAGLDVVAACVTPGRPRPRGRRAGRARRRPGRRRRDGRRGSAPTPSR